jgi:ribosomal protein S18 acetylase RimI-like enzyme
VIGDLVFRPMARRELDVLVAWAAREGWNPGLHDAAIFWATDPDGFVAAEVDGALVGGGSIVAYGDAFGFMGFFIMAPHYRGRGLGSRLWHHRRDALQARLRPGAPIGMDGVLDMQPFYAKGGFVPAGRDLRFEGLGEEGALAPRLIDAAQVPFDELAAYDARHFPARRDAFLERWIAQPEARALVATGDDGAIDGFGVIRRCRRGWKIGPLFAADRPVAEDLLSGLSAHAPGEPIFLDAPEANPAAIALARGRGMREVFGCVRMYLGPAPALPDAEIFGVTTFELG